MTGLELQHFLTHLAVQEKVSASTQNQALCALVFFYKHGLKKDMGELEGLVLAKRPARIPLVFSREEVQAIMTKLNGMYWIMAMLLYGAGLRLVECLRLRVKNIDFQYNPIIVRDAKEDKDRLVPLPQRLKESLKAHIFHTLKNQWIFEDFSNFVVRES